MLEPSERLHVLPVQGLRNRWLHLLSGEFWSLRTLRQFIRVQEDVDVVVAAIPSSTYYATFLRVLTKPIVAIVAGDEQELMTRSSHPAMRLARMVGLDRLKNAREQVLLRRAAAIVCRSERLARKCRHALGEDTPIHIITSGIDMDVFLPWASEEKALARQKLGLSEGAPVIGCAATALSGAKGADVLRKAFVHIREAVPDVRLLLVGRDRGAFAGEDGVIRLGWVPRSDLPECYAAMDVFACPSLSEGAPKVVMEACACGLPVVASRVGAIPEWFLGGQGGQEEHCGPGGLSGLSGLVVDVGDSEALANACLQLLSRPDLRAHLPSLASTTATAPRTWPKYSALQRRRRANDPVLVRVRRCESVLVGVCRFPRSR